MYHSAKLVCKLSNSFQTKQSSSCKFFSGQENKSQDWKIFSHMLMETSNDPWILGISNSQLLNRMLLTGEKMGSAFLRKNLQGLLMPALRNKCVCGHFYTYLRRTNIYWTYFFTKNGQSAFFDAHDPWFISLSFSRQLMFLPLPQNTS